MNANSFITINNWLESATAQLTEAGIGTAQLDALVLLEDCLNKDRAQLLAHPEFKLTPPQEKILTHQLKKRIQHEPLAYIRGKTEFYGRQFIVTPAVLEPRPETETMLELFKSLQLQSPNVVDVGTGSGAIAITAKLEQPRSCVVAVDIDSKCLSVAGKNIRKHSVNVNLYCGDLLDPVKSIHTDVILANLPYVPDNFGINKAALHEPQIAIFGGKDGLKLYRKLFVQISMRQQKPKYILTESLPFQHEALVAIAKGYSYTLTQTADFIQLFKLV